MLHVNGRFCALLVHGAVNKAVVPATDADTPSAAGVRCQVARSPSEVALRPFFGIYGPYRTATDPWSIPANNAFRKTFYYKALQWLSDPSRTTHK